MANERIFRKEAIDYHCRDPESHGVIGTRFRWTRASLLVVVTLLLVTAAYVWFAQDVVHALFARLLR